MESAESNKLRNRPARELVHVFSGIEFMPDAAFEVETRRAASGYGIAGRHEEAVCMLQLYEPWN